MAVNLDDGIAPISKRRLFLFFFVVRLAQV
jgi:hypothetical protein